MRQTARTAVSEDATTLRAAAGATWRLDTLIDRLVGTRGCCLTFHRVAPSAEWAALPDQGFTLELERLDALLTRLLRAGWDIVTMDEAVRRGPGARRFVNFSIDDCYRDTWELVAPLFRKHGVPVTVYVTTGIPNGDYELWYAGLETILTECREVLLRGQEEQRTNGWPCPTRRRVSPCIAGFGGIGAMTTRWVPITRSAKTTATIRDRCTTDMPSRGPCCGSCPRARSWKSVRTP